MKHHYLHFTLVLCAGVLAVSAEAGYVSAYARPTASVSSDTDPATDESALYTLNTGYLAASGEINQSRTLDAFNIYGSKAESKFSVSVKVGAIKAFASSNVSAAADFVNEPDRFNVAGSWVPVSAEWGDEMLVQAPAGSPAGKLVDVQAHVLLNAYMNRRQDTTNDTSNAVQIRYLLPGMSFQTYSFNNLAMVTGGAAESNLLDLNFALSLLPRSYNISSQITLETVASARINDPNPLWKTSSFSVADAGNSAYMYFDVLTPGASVSFASGADLTTAPVRSTVPEPATLNLLLAGLVGLGLKRKIMG